MRKLYAALATVAVMALAVLCAPAAFAAQAEGTPEAQFAKTKENVYCQIPFETVVELSEPAAQDITLTVTGSDGSSTQVTVPAGQTEAAVTLSAPAEKGESIEYTIAEGEGYTPGKADELAAKAFEVPGFSFSGSAVRYVVSGSTLKGTVDSSDSGDVVRQTVLTVRLGAADGEVVAEITVPRFADAKRFELEIDPSWGPNTQLYLCFDAAGTVCDQLGLAIGYEGENYDIRYVSGEDKRMSISFDCAYGTEFTDYILDTLDEYNAKVTFFVTGAWVENNPEYVKKIYERGHEIGNHTYSHPRMTECWDAEIYREISRVSDMVEEITGQRPALFRPPFGAYNARVSSIARYCGCSTILWSYDSMDWEPSATAEYIIERSTRTSAAGDIVLFHNAGPLTKETLTVVLDHYTKTLGLQLVRISDLIYKGDAVIDDNGVQSPGSDYREYTGEELFAGFTAQIEVQNNGQTTVLPLDAQFDDTRWTLYKGDAEAIMTGNSPIDPVVGLKKDAAAPVAQGDELGTAVFSLPGQPDITARLTAASSVELIESEEQQEGSGQDAEVSDGDSCSASRGTVSGIAAVNLVIIAAAVVLIAIRKRRRA